MQHNHHVSNQPHSEIPRYRQCRSLWPAVTDNVMSTVPMHSHVASQPTGKGYLETWQYVGPLRTLDQVRTHEIQLDLLVILSKIFECWSRYSCISSCKGWSPEELANPSHLHSCGNYRLYVRWGHLLVHHKKSEIVAVASGWLPCLKLLEMMEQVR